MGFRHESLSSGIKMLYDHSKKQAWVITATEDASLFNDEFLQGIDVAVFLNPSGDALNDQQQAENPLIIEHITEAINWAARRD